MRNNEGTLKFFLAGDVMTGRGIDQVLPVSVDPKIYEPYVKDARVYVQLSERKNGAISQPIDYSYIWGDALKVWEFEKPHLKIINLETSVTTEGSPWPGKGIQYRMHPDNMKVLEVADIDFISLANNHTLDWGRDGLQQTLASARRSKVTFSGAGEDIDMAMKRAVFVRDSTRISILSFGMRSSGIPETWAATEERSGVNYLAGLTEDSFQEIARQVRNQTEKQEILIISIHWGGNWGYEIQPEMRDFAHRLIEELGVDIVHGHSSHHPRGLEVYNDKLILYGAGDFINDYEGISGHEKYRDDLVLMYFPTLAKSSGDLISLELVPMQIYNFQLRSPTAEDAGWLFDMISKESSKLGTELISKGDRIFWVK